MPDQSLCNAINALNNKVQFSNSTLFINLLRKNTIHHARCITFKTETQLLTDTVTPSPLIFKRAPEKMGVLRILLHFSMKTHAGPLIRSLHKTVLMRGPNSFFIFFFMEKSLNYPE